MIKILLIISVIISIIVGIVYFFFMGNKEQEQEQEQQEQEEEMVEEIKPEPMEQIACEHKPLDIQCSSGKIIKINTAMYGRQDTTTCPGDGNMEILKNTSCSSDKAMDVVMDKCDGKNKCNVVASNDTFGDPCTGTLKYLKINYSCS